MVFQFFGEFLTFGQLHKENDAHVPLPVLADDEAVRDLRDVFHLAVDLGGPDADASGIQSGVKSYSLPGLTPAAMRVAM